MKAALKHKTTRQVVKYATATLFSACFTVVLPIILHEFADMKESHAVGLSLALAFVTNFITTRQFVFKSKGSKKREIPLYTIISIFFRGFEYAMFMVLHKMLGIYYMLALGAVLGTSLSFKFLVYKFVVFKPLAEEPGAL